MFSSVLSNNITEQVVTDAPSPVNMNVTKNKFGCLVEESVFEENHVEKTISAPMVPFHMDYVQ